MFSEWVQSVNGDYDLTRYAACLYIDEEVMTSVIEDEDPNDSDPDLILRPKAFVKLIHEFFDETPRQWDKKTIPDDESRERINAGDEGYPPIEGDKRFDVGWMKSSVRRLLPATYLYMGGGSWEQVYVRPPRMSNGGG
ncbi:uncharacterized protein MYCFIDRAFT_211942 [Pseudocercospora fijiensis CIRAD86]|uniref:Uncharacterized protein n=1 Tax=Pseudocercospora fijiensis (strain CIRAD86) TaxID=383855 RepID=M3ARH7_PSEFD|nr:uncharacterized protein MYCFIDRAFT_211942 [Pseudocercospora fijiensis CIRAD86]EME80042.1 hypothetical protein MYCFIDRAFT_211942 [Pseudocercospora fijiensis CIRAD86]